MRCFSSHSCEIIFCIFFAAAASEKTDNHSRNDNYHKNNQPHRRSPFKHLHSYSIPETIIFTLDIPNLPIYNCECALLDEKKELL